MSKRINWKNIAEERLTEFNLMRADRDMFSESFGKMHAENQTLRSALSDAKKSEQYLAGQIARLEAELRKSQHDARVAKKTAQMLEEDVDAERARVDALVVRLDWLEHNPTDVKVAT